jgi:hypothetical protein
MKKRPSACRASCASWSFLSRRRAGDRLFAYAEKRRSVPVVLMCGGLDALQTDYYSLYERYFAPLGCHADAGYAFIGFSSKWKLTQDTSLLHQHALRHWKMCRGLTIPGLPLSVSALARTSRCVWLIWSRSA